MLDGGDSVGGSRSEITREEMQSFLENCVGISASAASSAAASCDLGGSGKISYRDFRKCFTRLEQERIEHVRDEHAREEALRALGQLRQAIRTLLEIVDQPKDDKAAVQHHVEMIEATLRGRQLELKSAVTSKGLHDLMEDLRLPSIVTEPILKAWAEVRQFVAHASHAWKVEPSTYSGLLDVLRRALALLRGHLDAFYGKCHGAKVDLKTLLDQQAFRRHNSMIHVDELGNVLLAHGVRFDDGELERMKCDVLQVLGPHGVDEVAASELIRGYDEYKKRHGSLLKALISRMSSKGITHDEFFHQASAVTPTMSSGTGVAFRPADARMGAAAAAY
jgi:hypothetical protein